MKKLTKNDLKGKDIILISEPCVIVRHYPEIGYNSGLFGFNWTAYQISPTIIGLVGYRNFPANINILPYDIGIKYNDLLTELSYNDNDGLFQLKDEFLQDVKKYIK